MSLVNPTLQRVQRGYKGVPTEVEVGKREPVTSADERVQRASERRSQQRFVALESERDRAIAGSADASAMSAAKRSKNRNPRVGSTHPKEHDLSFEKVHRSVEGKSL